MNNVGLKMAILLLLSLAFVMNVPAMADSVGVKGGDFAEYEFAYIGERPSGAPPPPPPTPSVPPIIGAPLLLPVTAVLVLGLLAIKKPMFKLPLYFTLSGSTIGFFVGLFVVSVGGAQLGAVIGMAIALIVSAVYPILKY